MFVRRQILFCAVGSAAIVLSVCWSIPRLYSNPPGSNSNARNTTTKQVRYQQLQTTTNEMPSSKGVIVIGLHVSKASQALRKQLKLPQGIGLLVEHVSPESAADDSHVQQFDVLYKFNDQFLVNQEQLTAIVRMHKANTNIILTLFRAGQLTRIDVVLKKEKKPNKMTDKNLPFNIQAHFGEHTFRFRNCQMCHSNPVPFKK